MTPDKLVVTILSFAGIAFTYWFFLMKKEKQVEASESIDITVNGGYSPEVISIPFQKTTTLNFLRTDPTECLNEIVLGDFNIRRELPLGKKVSVKLTPGKKGEFGYSCGMNMYHGKIIVK